jgi:hypothetical protein
VAGLLGSGRKRGATLRELFEGGEMVDNARRIAEAVDIPVVADADTCYGIKADGTPVELLPCDEFLELIGMGEIRELERRFAEA